MPEVPYELPVPDPAEVIAGLESAGFSKWDRSKPNCRGCEIRFVVNTPALARSVKVAAFIRALEEKKPELIAIYHGGTGLRDTEYNMLAHMAIGILGRESEFFASYRYIVKSTAPWSVSFLKYIRYWLYNKPIDMNSRGPTQIKFLPKRATDLYGIQPHDLDNPAKAAIATMAFLIEAFSELKGMAVKHKLDFVGPATYPDYLPYIYFGARRQLIEKTATPDRNIYIRDMRKYMNWVEIYERPRRIPLR